MSKIVKNLLIGFTCACAIVLVVFVVEMILLNRDAGEGGATVESRSGEEQTGTESPSGAQRENGTGRNGDENINVTGDDGDSDRDGNAGQSGGIRPPPTGKRYELPMPDGMNLVLHAEEELFEHFEGNNEDYFMYLGEDTVYIEIRFVHMTQGVRPFSERFLDEFVGSGGTTVSGNRQIRQSPLEGTYVSGENNGATYEAWIHSPISDEDSNMGIAIIITYSNNEQRNAIYTVLDTMERLQT